MPARRFLELWRQGLDERVIVVETPGPSLADDRMRKVRVEMATAPQDDNVTGASGSRRSKAITERSTIALLPLVVRGNDAAAGVLFDRVSRQLKRFGRGRLPGWARSRMATDDLVQESLLRGWKHLPRFEGQPSGSLLRWLTTVLKHLVIDEQRRAIRVGRVETLPENLCDPALLQDQQLYRAQREVVLATALARLSESERALVRRRQEGLSFAQLAGVSGKPSADAARMAHRRALEKLRRELERLRDASGQRTCEES